MNVFLKSIFLLIICINNLSAEISFNVEVDEFTDEKVEYIFDSTGSSIEIEKSLERVKSSWLYVACSDNLCMLSLHNYYDDWNELGTSDAYVILDGEKWNNHQFRLETDIGSDVSESYGYIYQKDVFKKLLNSKVFRSKVGNLVYSIDLTKLPISKFSF